MIPASGTVIGLLRVHARDAGGVPHALARAELRPTGLAPSAVLVVRHLADPLPGVLAGGSPSPSWERAAASALERELRSAARPAVDAVPASAGAVLFADRAELLAALAAGWLAGTLVGRWWWRVVLRAGADPAAAVVSAWRADPRYVPAALGMLAAGGHAGAFARALPGPAAAELAAGTASAWGAPETVVSRARTVSASAAEPGRPPPWRRWVPESAASGPEIGRRLFLGVGLALARAPAAATRAAFWDAVGEWLDPATTGTDDEPGGPDTARGQPDETSGRGPAGAGVPSRRTTAAGAPEARAADPPTAPGERTETPIARSAPVDRSSAPRRPPAPGSAVPGLPGPAPSSPRSARGGAPTGSTTPHTADAEGDSSSAPASTAGEPTPTVASPAGAEHADLSPEPAPPPESAVTALGGLFFLLNVALDRGLYGDFTSPAEPGIALDPWDFVTLLGRDLLAGAEPAGDALPDDQVWGLLARLAGRDDDVPAGAEFVPPRTGGDRTESLREWVRRLGAELRVQLAASLRCTATESGPLLIRGPARVSVTAAHVDVTLTLAALPIEVRVAGLDRDPGWIPAAGRIVAFHFG